jgi:hypothetical protein
MPAARDTQLQAPPTSAALKPLFEHTRAAYWAFDEPRYFGHRAFSELTGSESWTSFMVLSIFGHKLPPASLGVIDDAVGALTLADPRIWPLKLTRVLGSYGNFLPALSGGILMLNGARIGPWACVDASKTLVTLHRELAGREEDPQCVREVVAAYRKQYRFVWGFGTPYRGKDERVLAFQQCMQKRGRDQLPYFRTMSAVAVAMKEATNAEPNIGGVMSAALLDLGLEPEGVCAMVTALVQHMFFAHAIESANAPNLELRELPLERVTYNGRNERVSPRQRAANAQPQARTRAETELATAE